MMVFITNSYGNIIFDIKKIPMNARKSLTTSKILDFFNKMNNYTSTTGTPCQVCLGFNLVI